MGGKKPPRRENVSKFQRCFWVISGKLRKAMKNLQFRVLRIFAQETWGSFYGYVGLPEGSRINWWMILDDFGPWLGSCTSQYSCWKDVILHTRYIQGIRKVVFHPQFCTQRGSMNCLCCFKETLPKPYYLISSTGFAGWVSWLVIKYDVGSTMDFITTYHHRFVGISFKTCSFSASLNSNLTSWGGGFFQTYFGSRPDDGREISVFFFHLRVSKECFRQNRCGPAR